MIVVQVKLYPTKDQLQSIRNHIDANRYIYNHMLGYKKQQYEEAKINHSRYDLIKMITEIKLIEEHYWLQNINTSTLQRSVINLDRAFNNFFRRVKRGEYPGFPKFKSRRASEQSYTYPQYVKMIDSTHIQLPNVGKVKCKGYRNIPGELKQVVIKMYSDGTIIASLFIANENQVAKNTGYDSVGIDVGTRRFLTDSSGVIVPKFNYNSITKKIEKQQARLARSVRDSNNRQRTKNTLIRYYRKLANKRKDNLHKLANTYTKYRTVYVEDLDIKAMTSNTSGTIDNPNKDSRRKTALNNAVVSQSWGMFFNYLDYKLKLRNSLLVKVNPSYTSQRCPKCGSIHKENRNKEMFMCVDCKHMDDADHNASVNIHYIGINTIRLEPKVS